jgi:hypothetical protein
MCIGLVTVEPGSRDLFIVGSAGRSSALDDCMLRDIRLSRADVEGEVSKPFWGAEQRWDARTVEVEDSAAHHDTNTRPSLTN